MMIYSYKEHYSAIKKWQNLGTSNMDEPQKSKNKNKTRKPLYEIKKARHKE